MKYKIIASKTFAKDLKKASKRKYDLSRLTTVVNLLAEGKSLPPEYKDHSLKFNKGDKKIVLQNLVLNYNANCVNFIDNCNILYLLYK